MNNIELITEHVVQAQKNKDGKNTFTNEIQRKFETKNRLATTEKVVTLKKDKEKYLTLGI